LIAGSIANSKNNKGFQLNESLCSKESIKRKKERDKPN
jgi:hypothetical protein